MTVLCYKLECGYHRTVVSLGSSVWLGVLSSSDSDQVRRTDAVCRAPPSGVPPGVPPDVNPGVSSGPPAVTPSSDPPAVLCVAVESRSPREGRVGWLHGQRRTDGGESQTRRMYDTAKQFAVASVG